MKFAVGSILLEGVRVHFAPIGSRPIQSDRFGYDDSVMVTVHHADSCYLLDKSPKVSVSKLKALHI